MAFNSIEWILTLPLSLGVPGMVAFNSIEWIPVPLPQGPDVGVEILLSIPLNGFSPSPGHNISITAKVNTFNSIEWIPSPKTRITSWLANSIFQFHWMDSYPSPSWCGCWQQLCFQFHWMDSHPLPILRLNAGRAPFNSIEWIQQLECPIWLRSLLQTLSIPLNGFEIQRPSVHPHQPATLSIPLNGFPLALRRLHPHYYRVLSIPLNGFGRANSRRVNPEHAAFQFHWMDSQGGDEGYDWCMLPFQFHWMDSPAGFAWTTRASQYAFNSIEWILHHHGLCCVWKFFHFHLYGFYSIKPPGGGLMIIVSARVYKRFSLIPQGFSHAVYGIFNCIL